MTSKAQRGRGWLLPEQVDGHELTCLTLLIPDAPEYRAAVRGVLFELAKWWNWQKTDDHRAADAAQLFYQLLIEQLAIGDCEGGDMPFDVRQNEAFPCRLEKSIDDGETWEQWANLRLCPPRVRVGEGGRLEISPDDGETWEPAPAAPVPAVPTPAGQDAKCLAAANVVTAVEATFDHFRSLFSSPVTQIATAVAGIISFVATLYFYPPAAGIVLGVFVGLLEAFNDLSDQPLTDDDKDQMRCDLYCNATLSDGVVTFDFDAVYALWNGRWNPLSINQWTGLRYILDIVQADGINRAGATGYNSEADCEGCPCECETYEVHANTKFNPTMTVISGISYNVTVTGTWTYDPGVVPFSADGDGGAPPATNAELNGTPYGCLLWRIGLSGAWHEGGTSFSFTATSSDVVYMGMNESTPLNPGAYGDNAGTLSVEVCPA